MQRLIVLLLMAAPLWAAQTTSQPNGLEIGFGVQTILPNRLPDLESKFSAFGPRLGIPLGKNSLEVNFLYGSISNTGMSSTKSYLAETNYRINVGTPFFAGLFVLGAHFHRYDSPRKTYTNLGGTLGTGIGIRAANRFNLRLEMKMYIQSRTLLAFGGAFILLI